MLSKRKHGVPATAAVVATQEPILVLDGPNIVGSTDLAVCT